MRLNLGINKKNKAQSTLEFAVLVACIVATAVAMGVYIKRGVQGRIRQSADEIGTLYAPGATSGTSSKTLSQQSHERSYSEPASVIAPGTGETINGKYLYTRTDIISESIQENVDERVQ